MDLGTVFVFFLAFLLLAAFVAVVVALVRCLWLKGTSYKRH